MFFQEREIFFHSKPQRNTKASRLEQLGLRGNGNELASGTAEEDVQRLAAG